MALCKSLVGHAVHLCSQGDSHITGFSALRVFGIWHDWRHKEILCFIIFSLAVVPVITNIVRWLDTLRLAGIVQLIFHGHGRSCMQEARSPLTSVQVSRGRVYAIKPLICPLQSSHGQCSYLA